MAFSTDGFNTIGASKSGNAPSIYTYVSADAIPTMSITVVLSNAAGVVDVSDGTAVSVAVAD